MGKSMIMQRSLLWDNLYIPEQTQSYSIWSTLLHLPLSGVFLETVSMASGGARLPPVPFDVNLKPSCTRCVSLQSGNDVVPMLMPIRQMDVNIQVHVAGTLPLLILCCVSGKLYPSVLQSHLCALPGNLSTH
jgi:hypothetical protein